MQTDKAIETVEKRQANDMRILKALYLGNYLNSNELERAAKLLYLLNLELKTRVRE